MSPIFFENDTRIKKKKKKGKNPWLNLYVFNKINTNTINFSHNQKSDSLIAQHMWIVLFKTFGLTGD